MNVEGDSTATSRFANLAELMLDRADRHPGHPFGVVEAPSTLGASVEAAARLATTLAAHGVQAGTRVALIGPTSAGYLTTWLALQLGGAEPALVNPAYPTTLLTEMMRVLEPQIVIWSGHPTERTIAPAASHIDVSGLDVGSVVVDGEVVPVCESAGDLAGLGRGPLGVAGFMHTSGTTGVPKFCVQTHEYFLRLGRFVADSLALSAADTVLAPLPMFHVNPLGYGLIGGLTGHSAVLGCERFSASGFWPLLREHDVTIAVLHAPPVEILKRATTTADAAGHKLRGVLYADEEFLRRFDVPLGLSVYGSTEVGGLSHTWTWRSGERANLPEGMNRYGGRVRPDARWKVEPDGEILIAADRPGVLFAGYLTAEGVNLPLSAEGWFHTGDIGRVDEQGNLVFIERGGEAIRVKGEYVPIDFVEERFRGVDSVGDVAIWRRESDLVDHEVVLYVTGPATAEALRVVAEEMPAYMRPTTVLRVRGPLPRDSGVGKVRRRELDSLVVLDRMALGGS